MKQTVGLLHPGKMGASVGAAARAAGHKVIWASSGRSDETARRATSAGLEAVATLGDLVERTDLIISVCPPHAAAELAGRVADMGFQGHYLDANAVSPERARTMAATFESTGATFSDGSLIGPPAWQTHTTRLYLSGPEAQALNPLFTGSYLDTRVVSKEVGAASALKMAFAAWTKGTSALLLAICALARETGVEKALLEEWAVSLPELLERSDQVTSRTPQKAWRFKGEMEEIAATFAQAGLPDGFHLAAADVYERLEGFKGVEKADKEDVLRRLLGEGIAGTAGTSD